MSAVVLACALVVVAGPARGMAPGPLAVDADGFVYVRHDPTTGARTLAIEADAAEAVGEEARLRGVSLKRYRAGRPVLTATSRTGIVRRDADTVLEGGVDLAWRGDSAVARFRCANLRYDRALGVVRSRSNITGVITGVSEDDEGDGSIRVVVSGTGLAVGAPGKRGGGARVLRDVVLEVSAAGGDPWIVSSDGGMWVESTERVTALRFSGPVEARCSRLVWSADDVELALTEERGGRLKLVRVFASGSVRAEGEYIVAAGAPDGEEGDARFEARAVAAEVQPEGAAVLLGSIGDPACVTFRGCDLRGTRLVLSADGVFSSGGATSVFEWGARQ